MLKGNLVETLFLRQLWITFVSFSPLTEAKGIHRPNSRNPEYFKISQAGVKQHRPLHHGGFDNLRGLFCLQLQSFSDLCHANVAKFDSLKPVHVVRSAIRRIRATMRQL